MPSPSPPRIVSEGWAAALGLLVGTGNWKAAYSRPGRGTGLSREPTCWDRAGRRGLIWAPVVDGEREGWRRIRSSEVEGRECPHEHTRICVGQLRLRGVDVKVEMTTPYN